MSNFTQKGKAQDPLVISLKRPESKTEPVTILPVIEEKKSPAPRVEQSKPRQRMKIPRAVLVALLAVLIGLVSGAGVFWFSHRQSAGASRAIATPKASPSTQSAPLPETTEEIAPAPRRTRPRITE